MANRFRDVAVLRDSLRRIGPLLPVFRFYGETIDGRKRSLKLFELGIEELPEVELTGREEAAELLFLLHPERALKRFPCRSAEAAAQRFCCSMDEVRPYFEGEREPMTSPFVRLARHFRSNRKLKHSLEKSGPFLPVYWCEGVIVDGRRRQAVCRDLGIPIADVELHPDALAEALFLIHPKRAIKRFPCEKVAQAVAKFHCTVAEAEQVIPNFRKRKRGPYKRKRGGKVLGQWVRDEVILAMMDAARSVGAKHTDFFRKSIAYAAAHPDVVWNFERPDESSDD